MKTFMIQKAHGAAVELNHFDQIEWFDLELCDSLEDAIKELDCNVALERDNDEGFEDCYYAIRDALTPQHFESLCREFYKDGEIFFKADGREIAWRIIEIKD